jgi:hypothetical protein
LFVRLNHEMNGTWFSWSELRNGNSPGQYVAMWRHVVDIFRQEHADNVTWVWSPNTVWADQPVTLASVYPGSDYVDWVGASVYNWGTNPAKPDTERQGFDELFGPTYANFRSLAPEKPIMIAEIASSEYGGAKDAWVQGLLETQLPRVYPEVKAMVWFNWNHPQVNGTMDWPIESSPAALGAFAAGIASSYYAGNAFGQLPRLTKVRPLGAAFAPPPPVPAADQGAVPVPTLAPGSPPRAGAPPSPRSSSRRIPVTRKGVFRVKLTCGAARGCAGRLVMRSANGRRVLVNRRVRVKPGRTTVRLQMIPAARRTLLRAGRMTAQLQCIGRGAWRHRVVLVVPRRS